MPAAARDETVVSDEDVHRHALAARNTAKIAAASALQPGVEVFDLEILVHVVGGGGEDGHRAVGPACKAGRAVRAARLAIGADVLDGQAPAQVAVVRGVRVRSLPDGAGVRDALRPGAGVAIGPRCAGVPCAEGRRDELVTSLAVVV